MGTRGRPKAAEKVTEPTEPVVEPSESEQEKTVSATVEQPKSKQEFNLPLKKLAIGGVFGLGLALGLYLIITGYPSRQLIAVYFGAIMIAVGGIGIILTVRSGGVSSFSSKTRKAEASDKAGCIRCFNLYPKYYKQEFMAEKSVCPDARYFRFWDGKMRLVQKWETKTKQFVPVELPEVITYPAERAARIVGCEPLQRLKSIKYGWLEQIAPFAPVVALLIGFLALAVVLG